MSTTTNYHRNKQITHWKFSCKIDSIYDFISIIFFASYSLSHLDSGDWSDPWSVWWNSSIDIRRASSARNSPRDGTNDCISSCQGTTWVTHACSATSTPECANGVIENASSVSSTETGATIGVGESWQSDKHEICSSWSWIWSLSPSWGNGWYATSNETRSQHSRCDISSSCNICWSLNDWDIVGESCAVVWWMVDDGRNGMGSTTSSSRNSADNDDSVTSGSSNCTVSSWDDPSCMEKWATTEVSISSCSQGDLISELASTCLGATNDASFPSKEVWVQCCIGNGWNKGLALWKISCDLSLKIANLLAPRATARKQQATTSLNILPNLMRDW